MIQTAPLSLWLAFALIGGCVDLFAQKLTSPLTQRINAFLSKGGQGTNGQWPVFKLKCDAAWQLELPKGERFDASALLLTPEGLLTLNDKQPGLFRIQMLESNQPAKLLPAKRTFGKNELKAWTTEKLKAFDFEGLAGDGAGRIYLCEEQRRAIFRFDPKIKKIEKLEIDWAPVSNFFSATDQNASFEGVALGEGKLYVANERTDARIIVVDLKSLKVTEHFAVKGASFSFFEPHYTDLSWFDGHLYVLLRHQRAILQVKPDTHQVVAEYEFNSIEQAPEVEYLSDYPTGAMEGLAVDANYFYLVTDNNGKGRKKYPKDSRPTLFRCPRPVVKPNGPKAK